MLHIVLGVFLSYCHHILTADFNARFTENTKHLYIAFIQCRASVFDVGPTLYKCYTKVLWVSCFSLWLDIQLYMSFPHNRALSVTSSCSKLSNMTNYWNTRQPNAVPVMGQHLTCCTSNGPTSHLSWVILERRPNNKHLKAPVKVEGCLKWQSHGNNRQTYLSACN